jgi:hypothetical protein
MYCFQGKLMMIMVMMTMVMVIGRKKAKWQGAHVI